MSIRLHQPGFAYAKERIKVGEVCHDDHAAWKEDESTKDELLRFSNNHSISEYGQWFLAIDTDQTQESLQRYLLPHGDLHEVHRCALLEVQRVSKEKGYHDIAQAAQELLRMIDQHKKQ